MSLHLTHDCDQSEFETDTPKSLLQARQQGISAFDFESEQEVQLPAEPDSREHLCNAA